MISGYILGNFLIYCVINAFTPGPGNILALNTVANFGWKKGKPLFFGIFAGYYAVQIICAVTLFTIGNSFPEMIEPLRYFGAAYIVWLAILMVVGKPHTEQEKKTASFSKGFLLQFVNIKIYLFGFTALTGYITDHVAAVSGYIFFGIVIATIGTTATLTWIILGKLIHAFYLEKYRVINLILALLLLECVYGILVH